MVAAFLTSKLGAYLISAVLIAGALGYVALRIHQSGVESERTKVQTETLDAKKRIDDAGARAPADLDGVRERLRDGTF